MSSPRVLLASIALACLVVGGALVYLGNDTPARQGAVAWAETAGRGTVFPACGSAGTSNATCNADGTAQVTFSWDVTGVHHTDEFGTNYVYDCTEVLLSGAPAGPVSGRPCTGTYTFTGLPDNSSLTLSAQGYYINWASTDVQTTVVSTPNCTEPPPSGTPTLSITKSQLSSQPGASCAAPGAVVHPGDTLCYRMFVDAGGTDQNNVEIRDHIPPGTTMVWQGGGTETNSSAQIAGGVDGLGDAWWFQRFTPASGWSGYVDFNAQVNTNYFSQFGAGGSICNTGTVASNEKSAVTSNTTCNDVGPVNPPWINAACTADGTAATLSWGAATGAVSYYPRLWVPSGSSCPSGSGWTLWSDGRTCYIDGYRGGTTIAVDGLTPGVQYSAWVHAGEPVDWNLPSTATTFTCAAPPIDSSISLIPNPVQVCSADPNALATVTVMANANVNYSVHIGSPTGDLFSSKAANDPLNQTTGNWVTNGMVFYLVNDVTGATLQTATAWFTQIGCPPPPPPTNFSAICNASGTAPTLSWNAAPGATNYQVNLYLPLGSPGPTGWTYYAPETNYALYYTYTTNTGITPSPVPTGSLVHAYVYSGNATGWNYTNSAYTSFNCPAPAFPDLSAWEADTSAVPFTPATSIILDGWIPNYGNAAVPAGPFPNLFQVSSNGGIFAFINQVVNASGPIAADTSGGASPSYVPVSASIGTLAAGSYHWRLCADNNASWVGAVSESNEGNNCNIWMPFTVTAASGPTCILSHTGAGTDLTLTWTSTGATTASINQGVGSVSPVGSGSTVVTYPTNNTTYTMTVGNGAGGSGTCSDSVTGGNSCQSGCSGCSTSSCGSTNLSCSPATQNITTGDTATWTASGGAGSPFSWFDALDNSIGSGSPFSKSYATAGTYAVTVKDSAGGESTSCQVTVGCTGLSASINATPARFPAGGGNTTISWNASGVDASCVITENNTTIDTVLGSACAIPNDSDSRPVTEQTKYCISCDGATTGQAGYDCVTVNVGSQFVPF